MKKNGYCAPLKINLNNVVFADVYDKRTNELYVSCKLECQFHYLSDDVEILNYFKVLIRVSQKYEATPSLSLYALK